MNNQRRGFGTAFKNILALLFLAVVLLVVAGFVAVALMPDILSRTPLAALIESGQMGEAGPTLAAAAAVPTLTPTATPNRLQSTWTPAAEEPETIEGEPTNTRRPTLTPSITPTFPSKTPTSTPTHTPTNTPTETPLGPTSTPQPTKSTFPFTRTDGSPFYLRNYANAAECNWLGIAGEVLDLNRNPVGAGSLKVHVWGSGIDERLLVGSAPAYSPSGYEQFVFDSPVIRDYNIQLESNEGTAVSQAYSVQTRASCNQNLLRFDFVQNH